MKRRFLAPEVILTSAMDCGPAALKSLVEGFGIPVSYGRLREVCQTDVDGTSIDMLEDLAVQLGLDAAQIILPFEHLTMPDSFPAILVTKDRVGSLHFVVAWRRIGRRFQIMDPARGRVWVDATTLQQMTFIHQMPILASQWLAWARGMEAQYAFSARFARIGAVAAGVDILERARADPSWRSFAALDATLRMTEALVAEKAVDAGKSAGTLVTTLFREAQADVNDGSERVVPSAYWSAVPTTPASDGREQILLTGAVLVRAFGVRRQERDVPAPAEIEAALREPPTRPLRHVGSMLSEDGLLTPTMLLLSFTAAAVGGALEALLGRAMINVGRYLGIVEQRIAGIGILGALLAVLLVLDVSFARGALRMGHRFETRLRVAFLSKIPRLGDRYFQSRPASDMAHRCHSIHAVRELPQLGGRLLRGLFDSLVAAGGLLWIDPGSWPLIVPAVLVSTAAPWLAHRSLAEHDLRARSFDGSLTRFYLDGLLGLVPLRAHGAERALRKQHSIIAEHWARAALDWTRASILVDALQQIAVSGLVVLLVFAYLAHSPEPAAALLFVYWALAIPVLGQEIARSALIYPSMRNRLLRLMEPLDAAEYGDGNGSPQSMPGEAQIVFRNVSVHAAGNTILKNINATISRGSHVAVVGASGAGKSSLLGLLLGWHRPASGDVLFDGIPLRGEHQKRTRSETAWVDPGVHLWNRSLLANLEYGVLANRDNGMQAVLEGADLLGLLERLPDGLQTELGEAGALVAGGEGQRVRLGRAMTRTPRLVILDEAFRGLDRELRHELLMRTRTRWAAATLLCVTHDIEETRHFDRVILLEDGHIREDGAPGELLARADSRYATMLRAEKDLRRTLWNDAAWRRVTVSDGGLMEAHAPVEPLVSAQEST